MVFVDFVMHQVIASMHMQTLETMHLEMQPFLVCILREHCKYAVGLPT